MFDPVMRHGRLHDARRISRQTRLAQGLCGKLLRSSPIRSAPARQRIPSAPVARLATRRIVLPTLVGPILTGRHNASPVEGARRFDHGKPLGDERMLSHSAGCGPGEATAGAHAMTVGRSVYTGDGCENPASAVRAQQRRSIRAKPGHAGLSSGSTDATKRPSANSSVGRTQTRLSAP